MPQINLFMGLCANTFTLVHSSFEKSMENILSHGFSCSVPNLAWAKVRNVADLKRIELQNQYLNKKTVVLKLKSIMLKAKPTSISQMSVEVQKKTKHIFCLTSLHFCYFALLFYYLHHFNLKTCYDNTTAKSSKTLLFYPCIVLCTNEVSKIFCEF